MHFVDFIKQHGLTALDVSEKLDIGGRRVVAWIRADADEPGYLRDAIRALINDHDPSEIPLDIDPDQIARILKISPSTVKRWRKEDRTPLAARYAYSLLILKPVLTPYQRGLLIKLNADRYYQFISGWCTKETQPKLLRRATPDTLIKLGFVRVVARRIIITRLGRKFLQQCTNL